MKMQWRVSDGKSDSSIICTKKGAKKKRKEGKKREQQEIARKMKAKGFSIDNISDMTGVTPTEIEEL